MTSTGSTENWGGGAVARWRWHVGGGALAVARWRWHVGGGTLAVARWRQPAAIPTQLILPCIKTHQLNCPPSQPPNSLTNSLKPSHYPPLPTTSLAHSPSLSSTLRTNPPIYVNPPTQPPPASSPSLSSTLRTWSPWYQAQCEPEREGGVGVKWW